MPFAIFFISINDLAPISKLFMVIVVVDDTSFFFVCFFVPVNVLININAVLKNSFIWLNANTLSLNIDKIKIYSI